jgi:periplasmic protein TonB
VDLFHNKFDDILFQNRNKDYGAYLLRKKYPKRLFIAFIISVTFFVLLFVIPYIIFNSPDEVLQESPYFSESMTMPPKNTIQPLNEILPELKKLEKKAVYTLPQVVNNEDDQASTELNPDIDKSDTTNNGTSTNGSSHGILDGEGSDNDAIYTFVQEPPSFPGGEQAMKTFIQRNIVYPKLAIQNKIQGRVYVSFIVEKNGALTSIKIAQGIGAGCDDEALRIIRLMPKWKAGKRQGHEVRVQVSLPLTFILQAKG